MGFLAPIGRFAVKYAPQILLTSGFISGAGAIVSSVFSTKRVIDHVAVEKEKRAEEQGVPKEEVKLTKKEVFKLGWKDFLVPAGMAVISGISIFAAFKIEHGRALTFAALGAAAEGRLASIEQALEEKFGKEKKKEIEALASQKQLESPKAQQAPMLATGSETGLFRIYDSAFGLQTKGTYDKILRAIDACEHKLEMARESGDDECKVSVADLWEEMGAHPWDIDRVHSAARNIVWCSGDTTSINVCISTIQDANNEPAFVLSYGAGSLKPKWDPAFSY